MPKEPPWIATVRNKLGVYSGFISPEHVPARHHCLLLEKLEAVERGDIKRLMVFCPPGSAKSHYANTMFASWYVGRRPKSVSLLCSATSELADVWGRRIRNIVDMPEYQAIFPGVQLAPDSKAVGFWSTTHGGVFKSAGVGGNIVGRRADLAVLDDPVADRAAADSPTKREALWRWYITDFRTRLTPGARVILIMTRWHLDDLAGRLLADMDSGGEQWEVVRLPMLAEHGDQMGRALGEPLWPEWFTEAQIALAQRDSRTWSALYQQRPTIEEGGILRRAWWRTHEGEQPEYLYSFLSIDTAYTSKDTNDPSACTLWGAFEDGDGNVRLMLRGSWAEFLEFPELVEAIADDARDYKVDKVLIEAKASGLSVIQELRRRLPMVSVDAVQPGGDKVARTHAVSSLLERGIVYVRGKQVGGSWVPTQGAQDVIDQCAEFPSGAHDDLHDTVTQALRWFRDAGHELLESDAPAPPPYTTRGALY